MNPELICLESSCKKELGFREERKISALSKQYLCNSQKARAAGRKKSPPWTSNIPEKE